MSDAIDRSQNTDHEIVVLLYQPHAGVAELIQRLLGIPGGWKFRVTHVDTLDGARSKLETVRFDVALLDVGIDVETAITTLVRARVPVDMPLVTMTPVTDQLQTEVCRRSGTFEVLHYSAITMPVLVGILTGAVRSHPPGAMAA